MKRGPNRPTTALGVLRHSAGLTLQDAADKLGVSWPYLSNIERGQDYPSDALARRIAKLYRAPLAAVAAACLKAVRRAATERAQIA